MQKQEAKQHPAIAAWIRHYLITYKTNCKVELKHTRGKDSFPFSELYDHQIEDLEAFVNRAPFVHKFDDVGYRKKPCDFIGVTGGAGFVAIRYDKVIHIISIFALLREKSGKRKSLTLERASEIAFDTIIVG